MFDYRTAYPEKCITAEKALELVKSNDIITVGMASAEPYEFLMQLHTIADRVRDVTITSSLATVQAPYLTDFLRYQNSFRIDSWFYSGQLRALQHTGRISFIPNHLHLAGFKRNAAVRTNIFICSASMPTEEGVALSCSNVYEMEMLKEADIVILEVSPNIPHTLGDHVVPFGDVDYIIESDYFLPPIPDTVPNEKDREIGRHIAELVNDGDCIQIGIGGIPNAVCEFLSEKKDLGVHTEMMTTGLMRLMQKGVVTNRKKQLLPGQSVCCFGMGTQELYAFMHDNPEVCIRAGSWVNDPRIIGLNDNQVSINTSIEVDLMGQCCSESIGHIQFSGTGGQADTAIGAQNSKNGRSFIALYSTAMVKNPNTGEREEISKIVPLLKAGATVSLSRNDVDYVVTEYGAVRLRGVDIAERARRLISIAHPKFRAELSVMAREYMFMA
ncbi:Butanoate coenzyme A-transferase [bioreactor metagenome]|uniref:Butanoate coenzyme A-transferase n=1 Tax=bioreactor metagenome TaxID=1076179 RepID=A0A644Y2V6_9ZZZZ